MFCFILRFSDNQFCSEGGKEIADALRTNRTLKYLSLYGLLWCYYYLLLLNFLICFIIFSSFIVVFVALGNSLQSGGVRSVLEALDSNHSIDIEVDFSG